MKQRIIRPHGKEASLSAAAMGGMDRLRREKEKRGGVYRFKEFHENPRLLERFLNSQVGRPWDKVYSEIRSNPDSRRSVGLRVLYRIKQLVATDCFLENKQVLRPGGFWGPYPPLDFYVHPKSGLLCRPHARLYNRPTPEITRVMIDELHWFEKIEGIWYRLDHEMRKCAWPFSIRGEYLHQTGKKQCSKKELKRIAECIETGRGAFYCEVSWRKERWVPVGSGRVSKGK